MRIFKIALISVFLIHALACSDKASKDTLTTSKRNIVITSNGEGLALKWKGSDRITGGMPLIENKDLPQTAPKIEVKEEGSVFLFEYDTENSPIEVRTQIYSERDAVVFTMTSNGMQSPKGSDYIGLFFEHFPSYEKGIASYLFGDWEAWTKPVQVFDIKDSYPEKLLFILFQYSDGNYGAMMPLGGKGYNATLGTQKNRFGARSVSFKDNFAAVNVPLMAISFGNDPYQTVKNLYEVGMKSMGVEEGLRKNKTYPKAFESIGWCSWNALGENVTESNLKNAIATFKENQFPIPLLLIDDGWLTVNQFQQLKKFNFDKKKFPKGFAESAKNLKANYGVKDIGVWHTMNGYWNGISPTGEVLNTSESLMPYYDKDDVHSDTLSGKTYYTANAMSAKGKRFYDDWYSHLKKEGISFLKVDQQSVIKRVAKGQFNDLNKMPYWDIASNMQNNLQSSIKEHFDGAVINCQDMATESVYNFTSSAIGRSSDDFFPKKTAYFSLEVEKGNAAAHILMNLHNSMWFSNMVWPDFDMFQSHHKDGEYHAISRAISGGPIYLTDEPGKQNFEILNQLVFQNGKILRPDVPALPTIDCLFQVNELRPFKAFSRVGKTGVLGVWNTVDADIVAGSVSPSDVHGLSGSQFAVYDYFAKDLKKLRSKDSLNVTLGRMGYKLYSIIPIEHDMAAVGLINKYISNKAILDTKITQNTMEVVLEEGGEFAALLPSKPIYVQINGRGVPSELWTYSEGLFLLQIAKNNSGNNPIVKVKIVNNEEG